MNKIDRYSFVCGVKEDKIARYTLDDWGKFISCQKCKTRLRPEYIPDFDGQKEPIGRLYYPADEYYRCTEHDTVAFYCSGCTLLESGKIKCIDCWKKGGTCRSPLTPSA